MRSKFVSAVALTLSTLMATCSFAEDWPQWMGPQRDNVWRQSGLIENLDDAEVVWRQPIAWGYAGPAVADGTVFINDFVTDANVKVSNFQRRGFDGTERLTALDAATGEEKWTFEYPMTITASYPGGPRCTPVVEDGRVYSLGAEGFLACLNAEDGTKIWSVDLKEQYKVNSPLWGYAAHPLIYKDKLITLAGGEGTHAVALDTKTGEELWRTLSSEQQGYAPPTLIEHGGILQLILAKPDEVASVNPDTGDVYWSVPYQATNGSIIMSPVLFKDHLFVGGYSQKTMLLKLISAAEQNDGKPGATVEWQDKGRAGISPVNVQPIVTDGVMYGFDQNGQLYAVELPSGKRLWNTPEPVSKRPLGTGSGFIVRQAETDVYWIFTEAGDLTRCRLTKDGFEELSRTHLLDPTNSAFGRAVVWSQPAFAGQRVYVRNDKEIMAVDLGE
ncbi:PQQ-binding-like beta-propeller repeat protein [Stratiformator vulcanicus]|uniref:Outer membrane protein assembly factor BamB n=1 Tax=Stratiformator vulcanicus TaxID=2527980 RepID=A0A517QY83_9PLAN|nr:PQQ-binding-like beta-propeller repeat protein [Stratiformator vulcanicus]QDT36558.1 Outer membrane protein assembly factor BamB precursor [Stratiformator vulcanicus]